MQLPKWGAEFNTLRERAYVDLEQGTVHNYILARSMGFCECCGAPGADTISCIAGGTGPRSYLALCGKCHGRDAHLRDKVMWLEDNLDGSRLLYVTAAIIRNSTGAVMVCQKSNLQWEFPGGKMEEGEDLVGCLRREIDEELGINLKGLTPFLLVDHDYGKVKLRLFSFVTEQGANSENVQLHQHVDYRFSRMAELDKITFSQADVKIAERLRANVT